MAKDLYQVLGVNKTATETEIKKAFRKLAQKHHPDRKGGDETRFKEVNAAYEILGDAKKRQTYDQFGEAAFDQGVGGFNPNDFARGQGAGGFTGFGGQPFDSSQFDFSEIFGSMFGGSRGQETSTGRRGADLQTSVDVALEEIYAGTTREVRLQKNVRCDHCGGSGAEPGSHAKICSTCNGSGEVRSMRQTAFGQSVNTVICPQCQGRGDVFTAKCKQCSGRGNLQAIKTYLVKIPRGAKNGAQIRFRGEGEFDTHGKNPGDLLVTIRLLPHPRFELDDLHLKTTVAVPFPTAALGGKIKVPTLEGDILLTIPAGTSGGKVIRVAGKGMAHPKSGSGDLLVRIEIEVPKSLTREQKELLVSWQQSLG